MSSANHARLKSWIHKQVFGDASDQSPIKVALYHVTAGKYGGRVATYKLPEQYTDDREGKDTPREIERLTDDILRDAEHDSQNVSEAGSQSYAVISMTELEMHVSRFPFRTNPVYDAEALATDTPDAKGLVNQLMRHNETREKTSNHMMGTMMSYMARVIDSLHEENSRMADERMQVMEITQKLLSEQQDRELKVVEHEAKQENIKELVSNVRLFLPAIAAKLTGQPAVVRDDAGGVINPHAKAIKELLGSLSPEQQQSIQSVLTPQQLMVLMQLAPEDPDQ